MLALTWVSTASWGQAPSTTSSRGAAAKALVVDGPVEVLSKRAGRRVLTVESPVTEGEVVVTAPGGRAKLVLADGSVLLLDEASRLALDEARFEGDARRAVTVALTAGRLWAHVAPAQEPGARFSATTDHAVVAVRGTIFRLDTEQWVSGAKGGHGSTVVRVAEGRVSVSPTRRVLAAREAARRQQRGPRREVAGPKEISVEAWERRVEELSAAQKLTVGVDLWELAADEARQGPSAGADAFARWIEAHR